MIEVATSFLLLVGGGLLLRSYLALQSVDPGYVTEDAWTFRIALSPERFPTARSRRAYYDELEARLESLPEIGSVSAVSQLPLSGRGYQQSYAYDEHTRRNWESVSADGRWVTPAYFRTIGATMIAGRGFRPEDVGQRVLIIDDRLAWQAFPEGGPEQAVGSRLQAARGASITEENSWEIIGVVRHLNLHDLTRPVLTQLHVPMTFDGRFSGGDHFSVVVRSGEASAGLAEAVRREVRAMGPGVAVQDLEPIEHAVARATTNARISLALMLLFGASALVLACVGVYGVLSAAVHHRRKEIGIRIALGQDRRSVLGLVMGRGIRLLVLSLAAGLVLSVLAAGRASGLLVEVSPLDPPTYVGAATVLAALALLASWAPARRATNVPPMEALRVE